MLGLCFRTNAYVFLRFTTQAKMRLYVGLVNASRIEKI